MLDFAEKVLYFLLRNFTWVFFFSSMFWKRHTRFCYIRIVEAVVLTCVQIICVILLGQIVAIIMLVIVFCILLQMEHRVPKKELVIEVVFAYAVKELVCVFCSLVSTLVCAWLFHTGSWITITIISGVILSCSWCGSFQLFRKKDLSALGEKYSVGVFSLVLVLIFAGFGIMKAPYTPASKELFLFALFTLAICFALLVVWARREHKILQEQDRLDREMEALARERDDLRSENHRLGKVLPGLEHQYGELAEWAKSLRAQDDLTEFSEELQTKHQTASQIRGALREQGGEGHSMEPLTVETGIDALDGVLSQVAQRASLASIRFDCRVWTSADVLLCVQGVTLLSLQQILSNLLDNALHAVASAGSEQRVITCFLGQAEGGYQIEVLDSGAYFAPRILENLGRRGNTTDGNGIGFVHILEALAACNASLLISEFQTPHLGGAVKSVAVRFDGKAVAHLSVRNPEIDDVDISIHSLLER